MTWPSYAAQNTVLQAQINFPKSPNHLVAYKLQNTPHLEIKTPDVKISIKNKKYTAY